VCFLLVALVFCSRHMMKITSLFLSSHHVEITRLVDVASSPFRFEVSKVSKVHLHLRLQARLPVKTASCENDYKTTHTQSSRTAVKS